MIPPRNRWCRPCSGAATLSDGGPIRRVPAVRARSCFKQAGDRGSGIGDQGSGVRGQGLRAFGFSRTIQSPKITNDKQSFALCVMIGAHNDLEYLNAIAITTPKMKIETTAPALSMWRAIQPGK
jgi:hypothetical protein